MFAYTTGRGGAGLGFPLDQKMNRVRWVGDYYWVRLHDMEIFHMCSKIYNTHVITITGGGRCITDAAASPRVSLLAALSAPPRALKEL